jgi:stage II sporulation protein GA (sporulation sigma-E factor processing peptidase)
MVIYADGVMLMNFLVDALLLMGTNRLTGRPVMAVRASAGAALGSIYSGACLLPGFHFLGGFLWRMLSLAAMTGIAFGWDRSSIKRCLFFVLLSMALGGIAIGVGKGSLWTVLLSAVGLYLFCVICSGQVKKRRFSRMELRYGERVWKVTALVDTGNLLTDPLTGQSVTVVSGRIAREMLGLTEEVLSDPVRSVAHGGVRGLRLIPYKALGKTGGMLPALMLDDVRIDGREGGRLVAFSPEITGEDGFEALIGGGF